MDGLSAIYLYSVVVTVAVVLGLLYALVSEWRERARY
jgi:hypothetical protein